MTDTGSAKLQVSAFSVSASSIKLLQDNAVCKALVMSWKNAGDAHDHQTHYTIEASLDGNDFGDRIELGTTDELELHFNCEDLNQLLSKLALPGNTAHIALRVRAESIHANAGPVYSSVVAVNVTTYLNYTTYSNFMKVPGNYQSWVVITAPQIVSTQNDGIYEGYVDFSFPYSQFLLVKGTQWADGNTFTNIGAGKFGFGGDILKANEGAGTYLVSANTNTNQWNCTRIKTWGIHGTALQTNGTKDPEMVYDEESRVYTIGVYLKKGEIRFRANNTDAISLGYKMNKGYTVPASDGQNFVIEKEGVYEIKLDTRLAGNYACVIIPNAKNVVLTGGK